MPGIVLHHREKRGCVVQIPRPAQLEGNPSVLPNNIRLDGEGNCMVSKGVFDELVRTFAMLNMESVFLVTGEEKHPPTLVVGGPVGEEQTVFLLVDGQLVEQAPQRRPLHVTR